MNAKPLPEQADPLSIVSEPLPHPPPSGVRISRRRERSRRKRAVRGRSICVKRLSKVEIAVGKMLFPEEAVDRPKTRGDCVHGERPCPFVSCAQHLYLDVFARTGAIKLNFPDLEVWEMTDSCALDVADRGGTTLEEAGVLMNLTRERIRQVEVTALAKMQSVDQMAAFRDHISEGTSGKRRLPVLRPAEDPDPADEDLDEAAATPDGGGVLELLEE